MGKYRNGFDYYEVIKMGETWPHQNELYYDSISGEFAVVDCMGESLTFYTSERNSRRVMDTYMFLAEFERLIQ